MLGLYEILNDGTKSEPSKYWFSMKTLFLEILMIFYEILVHRSLQNSKKIALTETDINKVC